MREIEEPTVDEYGHDVHPAFGVIGASRVSSSPPGAVLFDSDIRHGHSVIVRVKAARRKRDLHRDWISGGDEYVEVEMSEAQWASFVSSMNTGDGVPCTVRYREHVGVVPGLVYAPRLADSLEETKRAAHDAFDEIVDALDDYEGALAAKAPAAERNGKLATLRARIRNAVPNVDFAGKTMVEHTENVVTRARADIEAFVIQKAHQLGLDPGDIAGASPFALGSGEVEAESDDHVLDAALRKVRWNAENQEEISELTRSQWKALSERVGDDR